MKKSFLIFFIFVLVISSVNAQNIKDTVYLQQVVVSATGHSTLLAESPEVIRVITSAQIEKMKPSSLSELLQMVAGMNIETGTGSGFPSRGIISMNGFPADKTLVLVDAEKILSDHIHTGQNIEFIPVEFVDRIEIIRGASSSQYGSDAMGGIVNIITKRNSDVSGAKLTMEGGSMSTASLGMTVTSPLGSTAGISTYAGWIQSEGPEVVFPLHRIGLMHYRKLSLFNTLDVHLSDKTDATLQFFFIQSAMKWSGDFKYGQFSKISPSINHRFSKKLSLKITLPWINWQSQVNAERNELFRPQLNVYYFHSPKFSLHAGADYSYSRFFRTSVTEHHLASVGVFAQGQYNVSKNIMLMASLRGDKPENIDLVFSPKLSTLMKVCDQKLFFRASAARGFHAPTVQELYEEGFGHGGTALRYGNPDLRPEYSTTFTLSTEYYPTFRYQFMLSGYYSMIDDMIVPVYQGPVPANPIKDIWMRENIVKANIYGFELMSHLNVVKNLFFDLGYSWSDNMNVETNQQLPYKPGWHVVGKVMFEQKISGKTRINIFASVKHSTGRSAWNWKPATGAPQDNTEGLITPLKDYQMVNAGLNCSVSEKYFLTFKLSNILKQEIEYLDDAYTVYAGKMLFSTKLSISF